MSYYAWKVAGAIASVAAIALFYLVIHLTTEPRKPGYERCYYGPMHTEHCDWIEYETEGQ